jgi:cell division protein FtsQ
MRDYNELMRQLDAGGARYSQEISEVDLSDSEDVKVMTADSTGGVLVHLGNGSYLERYRIYVTHVEAWRQQFEKLESVDLRYDGQIIVNPDLHGIAAQPALTPAAAKAALAAGVKNAAIVNYETYVTQPVAPGKTVQPRSKEASKLAAKAVTKAEVRQAAHHTDPRAKAKTKTAGANIAVPHRAVQPSTKPAAATHTAPAHKPAVATAKPAPSASAPLTTVAGTQKKPSAAIAKEKPQN